MQNRSMTIFSSVLFAAMLFVSFTTIANAEQTNILFIYLDDFGWKGTGYMGSDYYETPNIDKLAADGMVFTDAYSCAANCAPARACLLSGQYTPRHKIYNVGTKPRGKAEYRRLKHVAGVKTLDPKIRTWAHQLKAAGYRTATIGKWHLSDDPLPYGFDLNIGGTHSGGPPKGYYPPHGKVPGLKNAPADEYLTDRLSQEAIKFIEDNQQKPWCLFLTHFAVHTPLHAKKELLAKYESKKKGKLHKHVAMATMIEAVDQGVGWILNCLDKNNLREKTIIVFYSDNGGYGPATDMAPLKGYKGTYYEGGIRVPFCVNWPGKIKPGVTTNEPITGVDLYPTFCDLAGIEKPQNQPLDGISLLDLWMGKTNALPKRSLYWHFPAYLQSYGQVNNEQRDPLFRSRPCSIIRKGNWKLHQYFEKNDIELYDLANDIGEQNNLAQSNPDKADELLNALKQWQQAIEAPTLYEPNTRFNAAAEAAAIQKAKSK